MTYTIAELIDDRNRELYNKVSTQIPIELRKSDDDGWGALTKNGKGFIDYAPSSYPISCFTHELLHLSFDLQGMARPGIVIRSESEDMQDAYDRVSEQLVFIYNQLIHHKIYDEFISMGFPSEEFLGESDRQETSNSAKRDLPSLRALRKQKKIDIPCKIFIYPYLFLRSPQDNTPETQKLLKDLRNLSDYSFYKVNAIINKLHDDPKPDIRHYLGRIFYLCSEYDVGFGYNEQDLVWARHCS